MIRPGPGKHGPPLVPGCAIGGGAASTVVFTALAVIIPELSPVIFPVVAVNIPVFIVVALTNPLIPTTVGITAGTVPVLYQPICTAEALIENPGKPTPPVSGVDGIKPFAVLIILEATKCISAGVVSLTALLP